MGPETNGDALRRNGVENHVNGHDYDFDQVDEDDERLVADLPERDQPRRSITRPKTSDERTYTAPPSSFSIPIHKNSIDRGGTGLADFFSPEVFRIVLHNPATAHRLLRFSQARMCGENMEFLEKVSAPARYSIYQKLVLTFAGRPL